MAEIYTTVQGDTWDAISYKVYGSEKYTGLLMQSNMRYLDVFVFDDSVILNIPEISEEDNAFEAPIWRTSV